MRAPWKWHQLDEPFSAPLSLQKYMCCHHAEVFGGVSNAASMQHVRIGKDEADRDVGHIAGKTASITRDPSDLAEGIVVVGLQDARVEGGKGVGVHKLVAHAVRYSRHHLRHSLLVRAWHPAAQHSSYAARSVY